jgi:Nitrous oxide-stimulated promoter
METAASHGLRPATAGSNAGSRGSARKRLARESRTLAAMIACYCEAHHHANGALCPECRQLLDYAALRLDRCRFGAEKPVCAKCPVHCYQPFRREQIRTVMRYAGPRMLLRHPVLSLRHWLDGFHPAPAVP